MARPARIEVEGARELRAALKKAGDDAADLKDANEAAGEIVADEARVLVPKGATGRLETSIRASRAKGSATVKAGTSVVPYAGVIHFGWPAHNMEPQPFLFDALDARRSDVIAAYQTAIDKIAKTI